MADVDGTSPTSGTIAPAPKPVSRTRFWSWLLAAGLGAGSIGWAAGEAAIARDLGQVRKRGNSDPTASDLAVRNGMIAFGALGAAMGMSLGLVGGLFRRSAKRTILAVGAGACLAAATGAGLARWLVPVYFDHLGDNELTHALAVHAGIWVPVGAVAGLAYGMALGGWSRMLRLAVVGGVAALLATVAYEFAGGLLMPGASTNQPVSATSESRLFARLIVAVSVALGMALTGEPREATGR